MDSLVETSLPAPLYTLPSKFLPLLSTYTQVYLLHRSSFQTYIHYHSSYCTTVVLYYLLHLPLLLYPTESLICFIHYSCTIHYIHMHLPSWRTFLNTDRVMSSYHTIHVHYFSTPRPPNFLDSPHISQHIILPIALNPSCHTKPLQLYYKK